MHPVCFRISWAILAIAIAAVPAAAQTRFVETDLVSDVQGLAKNFDPNLKNPWGMSQAPGGPFWVSDQVTGVSTLYNGAGTPQSLIVTVPPPPGAPVGVLGNPTGQVFNNTADFGGNVFIFASLNGSISAWKPGSTSAVNEMAVAGAVYTGLANGSNASGNFLYAANARGGSIDVFDKAFAPTTLSGHFTDPNGLPAGFTPYNIQNLGGNLYVAYSSRTTAGGVVDEFDTSGNFIRRIAANGPGGILNSPWGLVLAPSGFGDCGGDLLVGNEEGDNHINAFNPITGQFDGTLTLNTGQPFSQGALWALKFGTGGNNGGDPNTLYFTAGINDEKDGLFGSLTAVPEPSTFALLGLGGAFALVLRRRLARKG